MSLVLVGGVLEMVIVFLSAFFLLSHYFSRWNSVDGVTIDNSFGNGVIASVVGIIFVVCFLIGKLLGRHININELLLINVELLPVVLIVPVMYCLLRFSNFTRSPPNALRTTFIVASIFALIVVVYKLVFVIIL